MTTITLNENLNPHFQTLAKQAHASVDEFINDILAKFLISKTTIDNSDNGERWKNLLASMPNSGEDADFARPLDYGREQSWDF